MDSGVLLDLFGQAIWVAVLITVSMVLPSLIVGVIISVFQAATQINEQTLSFLPRLLVALGALGFFGPWIVNRLVELFNYMFMNIPRLIG